MKQYYIVRGSHLNDYQLFWTTTGIIVGYNYSIK